MLIVLFKILLDFGSEGVRKMRKGRRFKRRFWKGGVICRWRNEW